MAGMSRQTRPAPTGLPRRLSHFTLDDAALPALPSVSISDTYGRMDTVAFARYLEMGAGLTEARHNGVSSDVTYAEIIETLTGSMAADLALHVVEYGDEHSAVLTLPTKFGDATVMLFVDECDGRWRMDVAAATSAAADAAADALSILIPRRELGGTEDEIDVTFWMHHPMQGGVSRLRQLPRLDWSEMGSNYPSAIRPQLEALNAMTDAPPQGRLMVFHGPPGTGKTRYLQALAGAWSSWCDVHYVVDPDEMFATALYLHTVMLGEYGDSERWRLVVIEDGDEFIASDGKQRSGAGVARLLNVADGLIGQGLKVMVLVSTNVEEIAFNAAVIRSGRCGALLNFPAFPAEEAAVWMSERGLDPAQLGDAAAVPLNELYAFTAGA